jgi:FlgD Ig-like domain
MEPQGRHSVRQSRRGSARVIARGEPRPARPSRFLWIIIVGAVSALVGGTLAIHNAARHSVLYASDNGNGTLFGASASSQSLLSEATADFGHLPIVRVYYPGMPSPNAWRTGVPGTNHSAVVVSFRAPPTSILSGADDAAFSHFFDAAPTGHPIYWSYQSEPEPLIASGQFTMAQYKAAWAHLASLANAAHNPYLQSTLILMAYDLAPQAGRNWKDYMAGGGVISVLAWDAYPAGSVHDRNPQLTPPADFMGAAVAASKSVGLPFGFAEFSLARADGRPGWLAEVGSYLQNVGALFGTLFNSHGWPAMMLSDAPSQAAWRAVVAKSGTTVPLTAPSPAPSASAPAPATLAISGLTASPATFAEGSGNHATLSFTLTQRADITIAVLNSQGAVVRQQALPNQAAGPVTYKYYGHNGRGQLVAPGRYPVLIVASNVHGSYIAERVLTITAP